MSKKKFSCGVCVFRDGAERGRECFVCDCDFAHDATGAVYVQSGVPVVLACAHVVGCSKTTTGEVDVTVGRPVQQSACSASAGFPGRANC